MNAAAPPSTTAPLWAPIRATFGRVIAAVGAPAAIALLTLTSNRLRLDIVRQLLALESLVRKLLLVEAAALELPRQPRGPRLIEVPLRTNGLIVNEPPRKQARPTLRPLDLARPETWTAQFALSLPRDTRIVSDRRAPRIRALWGHASSAAPQPTPQRNRRPAPFLIARRFEALRRVLNDPAPHARRLACAQRRASARSPGLIKRYALATPRRYAHDPCDPRLSIDVVSLVLRARAVLADTS